jgi:hypothetical protein
MNSCVRSQPTSSKRSSIRCTDTGQSKIMRICCSPPWEARQPGPSSGPNADSIGKLGSSDVTSTVAICSRSSQPLSDWPPCWAWCGPTILFRIVSFSSQNDAFRFILRYQPQGTARGRLRKVDRREPPSTANGRKPLLRNYPERFCSAAGPIIGQVLGPDLSKGDIRQLGRTQVRLVPDIRAERAQICGKATNRRSGVDATGARDSRSPQLGVFRFGLLKDRDVGVCIFPKREEGPIRRLRLGLVS